MSKVDVKGSARLFENPILEALTRTNPYITLFTYVPILVTVFIIGVRYFEIPLTTALLVSTVALFIWTLVEYLMHRYIYHFVNDMSHMLSLCADVEHCAHFRP